MNFRNYLLIGLIVFNYIATAQESKLPKFGDGIIDAVGKDSTWGINFSARMQFLGEATWQSADGGGLINPQQLFLIRRARLKFEGFAYTPKLTYKFQLGLSDSDLALITKEGEVSTPILLDAIIMWNFYGNFELWAGQAVLPGNLERTVSSGELQLVDRSLLNSYFNLDRDIGIQIRHYFNLSERFLVRDQFAISQGEGRNVLDRNLGGYQYTGRLELLPFGRFTDEGDYFGSDQAREKNPKLMISAAFDINKDAVRTSGNQGIYLGNDLGFFETDVTTYFADGIFKYRGFSFMAEYAHQKAKNPVVTNSDGSETGMRVREGAGVNLQSGYLFENNWEIAGRYTKVHIDGIASNRIKETQYTLGISKYIAGHKLKVQSDLSYLIGNTPIDGLMWRLQCEIHF